MAPVTSKGARATMVGPLVMMMAMFFTDVRQVAADVPEMARLKDLDVKCSRSGMTVRMAFDRPFAGVIYSKGHYFNSECNYVTPENTGRAKYIFQIPLTGCGTSGQLETATPERDMFFENTVILQNDELIQEVWDEAHNLRCVWQHTIRKSVASTPIKVSEPEKVNLELDLRALDTLMEIQKGPGPFSAPTTGYVHEGEDTSVVIYVQDPGRTMDARVVSCRALGAHAPAKGKSTSEPVDLIDSKGCVLEPEVMTQFSKTRETNGVKADIMLYSYLKSFRVSESPNFVMSCELEVCHGPCSAPCSTQPHIGRRRRSPAGETPSLGRPSNIVAEHLLNLLRR